MSTIPQRLRSLANVLQEGGLEMNASKLLEIAAELEAHDPAPVQENRHGSVAFQYLREEVARAMAPVHAAFDDRAKAENPAADAVPVVAWEYSGRYRSGVSFARPDDYSDEAGYLVTPTPLIRQSDHIAAVAALQARINALEARQVPEGEVHFIQGGKLVGKIINIGSQPDTSKEQP